MKSHDSDYVPPGFNQNLANNSDIIHKSVIHIVGFASSSVLRGTSLIENVLGAVNFAKNVSCIRAIYSDL